MSAKRNNHKSTSPEINDSSLNNNNSNNMSSVATSSTTYPLGISFSSNSTFAHLNDSDEIAHIEKRTAHNALERQRREGLNTKFQELAHVLPALQQIRRPSKSMIVAKSLEFVSSANKRENEFQGQIHALRKENAQLMRQASISKKRMKKHMDTEKMSQKKQHQQNGKQKSTDIASSPSAESSSSAPVIVKHRKRSSNMKPQLRRTSIATKDKSTIASSSSSSHDESSKSADNTKPTIVSNKRSRETESPEQPTVSVQMPSPTAEIVPHSPPKGPIVKKRKRNATAEVYPPQPQPHHVSLATHYNYLPTQSNAASVDHHISPILYRHRSVSASANMHPHQFNNPQTSTLIQQQGMISPVVSRHNSLTINDPVPIEFNETTMVPSQFNVISSPFGNEHIFYNNSTFDDSFENVVSAIPAMTTPVGSTTTAATTASTTTTTIHQIDTVVRSQQPPHYDSHLDLIQSIMQSQDSTENQFYHWH